MKYMQKRESYMTTLYLSFVFLKEINMFLALVYKDSLFNKM